MIVTLVALGVLVAVWGFCQRRRIAHAAALAGFDHREAKLHADVDELLYALTDMEYARQVLSAENLA